MISIKAIATRSIRRPSAGRCLRVEALEERRLLDAGLASAALQDSAVSLAAVAPWQNPTLRLDVNKDGIVTPNDILVIINRINATGGGPLTPPTGTPANYYDTTGDNQLTPRDVLVVINRLNSPPTVDLTTLVPFTADTTPQVMIKATSSAALPDGTQVKIDVDLNNDGVFSTQERNYTTSTIYGGAAIFDLNPALPVSSPTAPYTVGLRARVIDADGVEGTSTPQKLDIDSQVSDALKNYVTAFDPSFSSTIAQITSGPLNSYKVYTLNLISQTWRTSADVDKTQWQHWVQVIVPAGPLSPTALLLINGGSTQQNPPSVPDSSLLTAAVQLRSVVINLPTVPNEPLTFTGDNPTRTRSEDAIIAYSFDQYMNHLGDPGDETWPVLLAMTKSAVKTMDAVQTLIPNVTSGGHVDNFVVTGYSKRGWTTWLTAAADERVKAIIPGVFDNLNLGIQMVHHYGAYGFFSPAIQDYNDMHIFDRIMTSEGEQLQQIVDPYRYLNDPRFATMPKLLINSAGDEFFASDSAQFYFHDLPGSQNYLRYIPNVGHGLNDTDPVNSTLSFYEAILNNRPLPQFSWTVQTDGSIRVQTTTSPTQVQVWQATNPTARDFRHAYNPSIVWTASGLASQGNGVYVASLPTPATGATAFFVELTFPSGIPTIPFVFTTEIHVDTNLPLFAWPYPTGLGSLLDVASAASLADPAPDLGIVVTSLVMTDMTSTGASQDASVTPSAASAIAAEPADQNSTAVPAVLLSNPLSTARRTGGARADGYRDAIDAYFRTWEADDPAELLA